MRREEFEKMSDRELNSMRRWSEWGKQSLIALAVAVFVICVLGKAVSIGEDNGERLAQEQEKSRKIANFYQEITATVLTDKATLAAFAKAAPSTLTVNQRGMIEHRCIVQMVQGVESLYSVDIAVFSSSTSDGHPIVGQAIVHNESVNDCVGTVGKEK